VVPASGPGSGKAAAASVRRGDLFDPGCPTRRLLDRVGGKWVAMIVKVLADADPQDLGFAQLERRVPGVSHKMLAQTLRSLAADGLVTRRVEPSVPPRVYYRLTPLGLSLDEPLAVLREWAEQHMPEIDDFARRAPTAAADQAHE
jgi:DNA-binding HxlR family transcriptional regulator